MSEKRTAVVTGASHGIGAGLVEGFLNKGYNVVATALDASTSMAASPSLVLIDGDISKQETAAKTVEAAGCPRFAPRFSALTGEHPTLPYHLRLCSASFRFAV